MKIKCPDNPEIVDKCLTAGKVYDVVNVINERLVVIVADPGYEIPVNITESAYTGYEPWEIVE